MFGVIAAWTIVGAMFVAHATRILQKGSIFESLRRWLASKLEAPTAHDCFCTRPKVWEPEYVETWGYRISDSLVYRWKVIWERAERFVFQSAFNLRGLRWVRALVTRISRSAEHLEYPRWNERLTFSSYIRVNASTFSEWFWAKANEGFNCPLCLSTQLSLWSVALPAVAFGEIVASGSLITGLWGANNHWTVELALAAFVWFTYGIAAGYVGKTLHEVSETWNAWRESVVQATVKIGNTAENLPEAIATAVANSKPTNTTTTVERTITLKEALPLDDFDKLVRSIDAQMAGISCPIRRGRIIRTQSHSIANQWTQTHNIPGIVEDLERALLMSFDDWGAYYESRRAQRAYQDLMFDVGYAELTITEQVDASGNPAGIDQAAKIEDLEKAMVELLGLVTQLTLKVVSADLRNGNTPRSPFEELLDGLMASYEQQAPRPPRSSDFDLFGGYELFEDEEYIDDSDGDSFMRTSHASNGRSTGGCSCGF